MPRLRDVDSGELHIVGVMKRRLHKDPFTMVFCEELAALITDADAQMSQLQWKVLMYLIAVVEYENAVDITITDIARAIGHDRSSVSRALRRLEALDLVHRVTGRGTRRQILLDPHLVFRGREPQRAQMLKAGWPPALPGAKRERQQSNGNEGTYIQGPAPAGCLKQE